jgi:LacI family transcriptional regulator
MGTTSIKEVAARANVAVGTVSNVLNHPDRVSAKTKQRVLNAINELGFVRNDAARQLRAGRSRTIGLIVLDSGNPFFASLTRAAEAAAFEAGAAVITGSSGQDSGREEHYIDLFEEQRVQGVLISPVGDIHDRVRNLAARGVPVVLVDREGADDLCSSVSVDDVAGGHMAVSHLLETGRRRIAFAGGSASIRQVSDRLSGAQKALTDHPDATLEILSADEMTVLAGRSIGQRLIDRGREHLPDGIFCANDLLAVGILQSLLLIHGLRVPEDVALIGYDDIDFAESTVVPLSSIRQPADEIGRTAVELLREQLSSPAPRYRQVKFRPELRARQSTLGAETPAATS